MSTNQNYLFEDTESETEFERLRAIEDLFDPATRRRLLSVGLAAGWRCLEVGAGAGSVAQWISRQVGRSGHVVALDIDDRFLGGVGAENLEIVEGDIRTTALNEASFDLVHARYVLIHIPDWPTALSTMLHCLKPAAWLLLEEPDFSVARSLSGREDLRRSFDNVYRAIEAMFSAAGMDHTFGCRIPALLQENEFEAIEVENDAPIQRGGSPLALMMKMSTLQLREKYVRTGLATEEDIARFCEFASDPGCWAIYYATVRGAGQKSRRAR